RLTGLRQKGKNARRSWSKRDKPMRHPSGQGDGVIGGHDAALIANPHLQRAVEHDDDFVGGVVEMRLRARRGPSSPGAPPGGESPATCAPWPAPRAAGPAG